MPTPSFQDSILPVPFLVCLQTVGHCIPYSFRRRLCYTSFDVKISLYCRVEHLRYKLKPTSYGVGTKAGSTDDKAEMDMG